MDEQLKIKLLARLGDGRASGFPDPDPCWNWRMALTPGGYGQWTVRGLRTSRAHRITWMLMRGPIPEGMYIDHACRNKACVNPNHLRVVTPRTNSLEHSDGVSAVNARRTVCLHGHGALSPHPYVAGRRICLICYDERNRANQARRRELGITPQTPVQPMCRKGLHRLLDDEGEPTSDLLVRSDGRRECRGCHRERERRRQKRLRDEARGIVAVRPVNASGS